MKLPVFFFIFLFLFCISCEEKGKNDPEACNGNTRREIKTLTDANAIFVDTIATPISLADLGAIPVPEVNRETGRLALEYKRYTVRATVDKLERERDGDYHIRLTDGSNYLITEAANPGCVYAQSSAYLAEFKQVRDFISANEKNLEGKEITITGIAFVDIDHHYSRKQAKNNMELHPILEIGF